MTKADENKIENFVIIIDGRIIEPITTVDYSEEIELSKKLQKSFSVATVSVKQLGDALRNFEKLNE